MLRPIVRGFAVCAFTICSVKAATYVDLGEFANVNNEFWDTRGHAAVVVDEQSASSSAGFDPRGRDFGVAVCDDIDPRGWTFGESDPIPFRSDMPRGAMIILR